tara:strand:+ start:402 stop:578 length:177 start_codon:yes stop_codon:yes gene_type:complete
MIFESVKWDYDEQTKKNVNVIVVMDGVEKTVPMDKDNTHYAEILKQVADGDLTIAAAD